MEKFYQEAVNLLTSQGKFYIKLGLERITTILELIGNPQNNLKCIHVAGTNGKGSTCAVLSTILTEAGFKTGLFTSPHIFEYTERIKINGIEISQKIFAEKIFKIQNLAEKNNLYLTEFEILTAVMFEYFAQNDVDYVVLETGLGGRYDATNVINKSVCSIITHIDFDHTERLGEKIEQIAFEKAGIIKKNCPVIILKDNQGFEVVKKFAGPQLILAKEYKFDELSLKGIYQQENLSLALSALNIILPDIKMSEILNAIKKVKHPCRFEILKTKNIIIDGAHNPNGIKALRESLDKYYPNQTFKFVFGCLKNKDYKQMLENLLKTGDEIYFYEFHYPNACSEEKLSLACPKGIKKLTEFPQSGEMPIIICGSLYMIKEVLDLIQ